MYVVYVGYEEYIIIVNEGDIKDYLEFLFYVIGFFEGICVYDFIFFGIVVILYFLE